MPTGKISPRIGEPIETMSRATRLHLAFLLASTLLLPGCANMNRTEQRVVSGAAIGAVVAGPIGAGVGAGVGYVVERFD